jgi:hypothetical protein
MTGRPATARQLARLDRLLAERDTAGEVLPRRLSTLTGTAASDLIAHLEGLPVRRGYHRPAGPPVNGNGAGPGVYDIGGEVFRLRCNRAGTGVYPERLVALHGQPPRWVYAPEVARRIYPQQRVTNAQATGLPS